MLHANKPDQRLRSREPLDIGRGFHPVGDDGAAVAFGDRAADGWWEGSSRPVSRAVADDVEGEGSVKALGV